MRQKIRQLWNTRFVEPLNQTDLNILLEKKGENYKYIKHNQDDTISFQKIPISRFSNSYTHKKSTFQNKKIKDLPPQTLRRIIKQSQQYNPPQYLFNQQQHPTINKAIQKLRKQKTDIFPLLRDNQRHAIRSSMILDNDLWDDLIYIYQHRQHMHGQDYMLPREPNVRWYEWTFQNHYQYLINHPYSKRISFADYYQRYFFMLRHGDVIIMLSFIFVPTQKDSEFDIRQIKNKIENVKNAKNHQSRLLAIQNLGLFSTQQIDQYYF
jgi:hypothetical protein